MNRVNCPDCGHKLKYADEHAGKRAKCPKCAHSFRLAVGALPLKEPSGQSAQTAHPDWLAEPSPGPVVTLDLSMPRKARRRWFWFAGGFVLLVIAGGTTFWMLRGGTEEGYIGPPPPVEFKMMGYQVNSWVPFYGELAIRDNQIIPPPAPDGYEFTLEHEEIILGTRHSFGWKSTSGVLLLVSCKVVVRDPAPRLEEIRLMRGKREVAMLDGLAQPGFEKVSAKDLNDGLAECHQSGKTPEVALVFRVPSEEAVIPSELAIEMRWRNHEDKTLAGSFFLRNVARFKKEEGSTQE